MPRVAQSQKTSEAPIGIEDEAGSESESLESENHALYWSDKFESSNQAALRPQMEPKLTQKCADAFYAAFKTLHFQGERKRIWFDKLDAEKIRKTLEELKEAISEGVFNINAPLPDDPAILSGGRSPLIAAIAGNSEDVVRLLLSIQEIDVSNVDSQYEPVTPLQLAVQWACSSRKLEVLRVLLADKRVQEKINQIHCSESMTAYDYALTHYKQFPNDDVAKEICEMLREKGGTTAN